MCRNEILFFGQTTKDLPTQGGLWMSIFDVLTFVGGLCLFLFGMRVMSQALAE